MFTFLGRAVVFAVAFILVGILPQPTQAQRAGDWPMYSHDLASTRYSSLAQINTTNVATLTQAWSYSMKVEGKGPSAASFNEVTPIVVNDVMYLADGNRILALEPETGKEVWRFELDKGLVPQRGVAYWPGDSDNPPRIIFTSLHRLMALNATTGKLDPKFGTNGEVEMDVPFAEVPTIYKDIIIVGANVYGPGETNLHPQDEVGAGVPGIRAPTMRAPAKSFGRSTPSRSPAKRATIAGETIAGKAAAARTYGPSP